MTMPEGEGFDFEAMAESIVDSPDPITPKSADVPKEGSQRARESVMDTLASMGPKRGRPRKEQPEKAAPKPKKELPPRRRGSLVKPLEQMYGALAIALMPFDQVCSTAIMNAAPKCAETLDELAYENEAVRRVLLSLITTSVMGQVLLAHAPILMAIMMHHVPAVRDGFGNALAKQTAKEAEDYLRENGAQG